MISRENKLNAHFKKLAAEFILRNANPKISLITVTDFHIDSDFKHAVAYISVYPPHAAEDALGMLNRKSSDFRGFLKSKSRMRAIPSVQFQIDRGEENRRRIDELMRH